MNIYKIKYRYINDGALPGIFMKLIKGENSLEAHESFREWSCAPCIVDIEHFEKLEELE